MKKNTTGGLSRINMMLLGMTAFRPATPGEIKMLSDFLRAEELAK